MAKISLEHIKHSYLPYPRKDQDFALKEVHHDWQDGGAYALLGPSGCGKTTLLNIISGLLHPSHGKIAFDGKDVTGLSTQERNIAQVFQFPVIYDTMTVYDNLAFPLRNRGVPETEVERSVRTILEMIDLSDWSEQGGKMLPTGYWLRGPADFAFDDMTASAPVAREGDGDCCPRGGNALFDLDIQGDRLMLTRLRFQPMQPLGRDIEVTAGILED